MTRRQPPHRARSYGTVVRTISQDIRESRFVAARAANRVSLLLYYRTGRTLANRVKETEWGDAALESISAGIQRNFPGIRGFSVRNLYNMREFHDAYSSEQFLQSLTAESDRNAFLQLATAEMSEVTGTAAVPKTPDYSNGLEVFLSLGFTHHILLIQKCPNLEERFFYMCQAATNQWSVEVLRYHITAGLHKKKGKITSNFTKALPQTLKAHALEAFKDEYLLNFVNVNENDGELVLENELVRNIRDFLMSLGKEFAFMGNQYRMVVDGEEFFVDLLFYHRQLRSLIAIDLKAGKFKPEFAGKMNFYLEALDQYVKLDHENPSIGIILCREKKDTIVEFAFKRVDRPMGVATYVLSEKLPPHYRKFLPTPSQLKKATMKGKSS